MKFKNRAKLITGLIIFSAICVGFVLYIDSARSSLGSQKAELKTDSYAVGLDFSGIILEQYVNEGDMVKRGQSLLLIKSATLTENLNNKNLQQSDLLYPLDKDGNVIITSSQSGLVERINYRQGSFFPANKELANISDAQSVYVKATYRISPRDFNNVTKNSRIAVSLPDGSVVSGSVRNTKIVSQSDIIVVEMEAKLANINATNFRTLNGTPVSAELTVRDNTFISQLKNKLGM
jgi:HlyD family secretion protein